MIIDPVPAPHIDTDLRKGDGDNFWVRCPFPSCKGIVDIEHVEDDCLHVTGTVTVILQCDGCKREWSGTLDYSDFELIKEDNDEKI